MSLHRLLVVTCRADTTCRQTSRRTGILAGQGAGYAGNSMLGIYLGAFLGPFGGNVVQVLLPVLQQWYGVDVQLAALSVTA